MLGDDGNTSFRNNTGGDSPSDVLSGLQQAHVSDQALGSRVGSSVGLQGATTRALIYLPSLAMIDAVIVQASADD